MKYDKPLFNRLLNDVILRGKKLSYDEAKEAMENILTSDEPYTLLAWIPLFASIQTRGVTVEEVRGFIEAVGAFARVQLYNSKKPLIPGHTISLVGSGKDDVKTINVSTLASIVLASTKKAYIIKQGSYAGSSYHGCRDILSSFGVNIKPSVKLEKLKTTHIAFLPIENFVRKFDSKYGGNFLFFHPLSYVLAGVLNPYHLDSLIMGITDYSNLHISAEVLRYYDYQGAITSGSFPPYGYIDELSPFGPSKILYFSGDRLEESTINPREIFGKSIHPTAYVLQTPDIENEKRKFESVLKGEAPIDAKALIAMNAGLGLQLIEDDKPLKECVMEILEIIDSGLPYETWEKFKEVMGK